MNLKLLIFFQTRIWPCRQLQISVEIEVVDFGAGYSLVVGKRIKTRWSLSNFNFTVDLRPSCSWVVCEHPNHFFSSEGNTSDLLPENGKLGI